MISHHLHHRHEGVENAISGPDLITKMNNGPRGVIFHTLRGLQSQVEYEREQGHPICSAPGVGYWWPRDLADAEHCIRWFRETAVQDLAKAAMIEDALTVDGQVAMF